jgi:uncharacterized alkaline shock family protein YloU
VAARVVARVATDAARRVPGVKVVLGRSTDSRIARIVERATRSHRNPEAAIGVLGRMVVVDLAVAVEYGEPVEIVREIQSRVVEELRDVIELQSITVNVTIDDVIE